MKKLLMPSLFIGHGAPTLALEQNDYTSFLSKLSQRLPKPEAIVLFSAHWEEQGQKVGASERYEMIYDFYGFPQALYEVRYPAVGHSQLVMQIVNLLASSGIHAQADTNRGLDHGAWVVLRMLYPHADIPVVTMSVNLALSNAQQYAIGKALSGLRREGVLIIGSGGTVHNLRKVKWGAEQTKSWAKQFDEWLNDRITSWDTASLFDYERLAPYAGDAVPRNEHFVPLLLAMGAADDGRIGQRIYDGYAYGTLSYNCWQFE